MCSERFLRVMAMSERDGRESERSSVAVLEPLKRLPPVRHEAGQVPFLLGFTGSGAADGDCAFCLKRSVFRRK